MRKNPLDLEIIKNRRQKLKDLAQNAALVLPSQLEANRNSDVHHYYRQESHVYYLTGFEEPEAIFLFLPNKDPESVLFVRKKDPLRETWDGFRFGPEGAERDFGIDKAYCIDEFEIMAPKLLAEFDTVYYRFFQNRYFDPIFLKVLEASRQLAGRTGESYKRLIDSHEVLSPLRLIKEKFELSLMREAAEISSQAHQEAMKFVRPGVNERQVYATLLYRILMSGCAREAYPGIVASGVNATTLHYVFNDQPCEDGDLLLIDFGGEFKYYASDITRTFPVSGKFTAVQKELYQAVLEVQKNLVSMVKPTVAHKSLQECAIASLVEIMKHFKLVSGSNDKIIEKLEYKKYYPHGVSHWLGMDVHDVGLYTLKGESTLLKPNMVMTIEPGLYIPRDDPAAHHELRGLGIRIEDDVVVTPSGHDVLTHSAPKEVSQLEEIIGSHQN